MPKASLTSEQVLRPAGRTATQALGPGSIVALLAVFDVIHWTPEQTAAVLVLAIPAWAWIQNFLERKTGKAFLIRKAG